MDLKLIGESVFSALAGGAVTAAISWIKMGRMIDRMDERISGLENGFVECKTQREGCRLSMRDHHESPEIHVTPSLLDTMKDIQTRMIRIESLLMNSKVKP